MNYFVIAGETSGDLHGGNLVKELSKLDGNAVFKGVGGNQLQKNNVDILFGLDRLAFMGFYEVVKNLSTINRNFKEIKQAIITFQPDLVILIDYPGFNLRMAKWCKKNGFKVAYYISPTVWAWNEKRVEIIKKYVDIMLCILPFEKLFYEHHNYNNAYFVGHPLLDVIDQNNEINSIAKNCIALLPGSRQQELKLLLPLMLATANNFIEEHFVIAGISRLMHLYPTELPKNVSIVFDNTYEVLQKAKVAVCCSGTATLETALFNIPQVVVYKTSWLNYQLAKRFIKVDFISLPNLIANEKLVTELIQSDCSIANITIELSKLLNSSKQNFYQQVSAKIGEQGAAKKAAILIHQLLQK